jgi:hypothetical protein
MGEGQTPEYRQAHGAFKARLKKQHETIANRFAVPASSFV